MASGRGERVGVAPILPTSRRARRFVVGVLGVALLLRVLVVVLIRDTYVPLTDAAHFDQIATSIANGEGYGPFALPPAVGPGAFRSPAYPFVLGVAYAVAGDHSWKVGLLQNAVLGTVLVALIGVIAAQLWSRRVGGIAMALAAVHPTLMLVGSGLQLEPLLVTLSLGALAATIQHRRAPRGWLWPVVAGVLIGGAILTRELAFALLPSMAWLLLTAGREAVQRDRRRLVAPIAMLAVGAAVVLPWTARNAAAFDAFVPVSSSSGFGLAGTYNEQAQDQRGVWVPPYEVPDLAEVMLALDEPDEVDVDEALRAEAIDFMVDNPGYVPQVAFFGTVRLFDLDGGAFDRANSVFLPYPPNLVWASVLATYPLLLAAAFGARTALAKRAPFAVWAIPIVIVVQIAILLPANVRYRSSIEPYLLFLASLALLPIVERVGRQRGWFPDDQAEVDPDGPQVTDRPS